MYLIVWGNKPSPVPLYQNNTIVFIQNIKMPKINLDGAEEPTINYFFKIDNRKF